MSLFANLPKSLGPSLKSATPLTPAGPSLFVPTAPAMVPNPFASSLFGNTPPPPNVIPIPGLQLPPSAVPNLIFPTAPPKSPKAAQKKKAKPAKAKSPPAKAKSPSVNIASELSSLNEKLKSGEVKIGSSESAASKPKSKPKAKEPKAARVKPPKAKDVPASQRLNPLKGRNGAWFYSNNDVFYTFTSGRRSKPPVISIAELENKVAKKVLFASEFDGTVSNEAGPVDMPKAKPRAPRAKKIKPPRTPPMGKKGGFLKFRFGGKTYVLDVYSAVRDKYAIDSKLFIAKELIGDVNDDLYLGI